MKLLAPILLFLVFLDCKSQERVSRIYSLSDEDIYMGFSKKIFSQRSVSEIFFTEKPDPKWSAPIWSYPKILLFDTIFYGIDKSGKPKYYLTQNIESWPSSDSTLHINDSGWRGYDTTFIQKVIHQNSISSYWNYAFFDSIAYNKKKQIEYMRYGEDNHRYVKFLYDSTGRLIEKKGMIASPDGGSHYKEFYFYNDNGVLIEIGYANPVTKENSYLIKSDDPFDFYNFPITEKKRITYNKKGQIEAIADLIFDKIQNKFIVETTSSFFYKELLLIRKEIKDVKNNEVIYIQNIGYKFFTK